MALVPTIISPGVEVVEIDNSVRASIPAGTTLYIPGFASQGPTDEVTFVSSLDNFVEIFGYPTNSAERYLYATVSQAFQSTATIAVTRLPYGADGGDTTSPQYTLLAYPATSYALDVNVISGKRSYTRIPTYSGGSTISGHEDTATLLIGEPVQFNISLEQYYNFLNNQMLDGGGDFVWDDIIPNNVSTEIKNLGQFAFVCLNVGKTVTNDIYEGYYLGLSDNAFSDPGSRYAAITNLKTVSKLSDDLTLGLTAADYVTVPQQRLDFKLDSDLKGCISQVMEESITGFDISAAQWNDTLNVGIFKVRESTSSGDALKLAAIINEGYNASLQYGRKTTTKYSNQAVDFFINNVSQDGALLNFFVNPHLSGILKSRGLYTDGSPKLKIRVNAQQLHDIAISEVALNEKNASGEFLYSNDYVMSLPAGISVEALQALPLSNPTFKQSDALYPVGLYSQSNSTTKIIGNVPAKVEKALNLIENEELYNIDILLEGGLGSIYVGAQDAAVKVFETILASAVKIDTDRGDGETTEADKVHADYPYGYIPNETLYDDTKIITGVTDMRTGQSILSAAAEQVIINHRAVTYEFLKVATSMQDGGRGDVFFIGDTIRQIAVEGRDNKVERLYGLPLVNSAYSSIDDVKHSFTTSIYWPLRHLYNDIVTSYMAVFPYFAKMQDVQTGTQFWAPISGAIAGRLASADARFGPWQAGAGLTNGVLSSLLDISFDATTRQRDDLYKISLNSLFNSPSNGILVFGVRTMIKKESVFDQITCRRTFLYIHKILRDTAKYFLFENNTAFTRLQVTNTMKPILDDILSKGGIYSFVFICDGRNNTTDVIDAGNLAIDVYISPVRTSERILISMFAQRSGTIITES